VEWKRNIEKSTRRKIKVLRSGYGGEYKSDPFLQLCHDEGIERNFTVRKTPQQNKVAERMNMTMLEKVMCMLSNAGLYFWAEALAYACYLVNMLPSSVIGSKTPVEAWSRKFAQNYDLLRVFGCPSYYHVKEDKLDPRAKKGMFIGLKKGIKSYKIFGSWDPRTRNLSQTEMSCLMRLQW